MPDCHSRSAQDHDHLDRPGLSALTTRTFPAPQWQQSLAESSPCPRRFPECAGSAEATMIGRGWYAMIFIIPLYHHDALHQQIEWPNVDPASHTFWECPFEPDSLRQLCLIYVTPTVSKVNLRTSLFSSILWFLLSLFSDLFQTNLEVPGVITRKWRHRTPYKHLRLVNSRTNMCRIGWGTVEGEIHL